MTPIKTNENKGNQREKGKSLAIIPIITVGALVAGVVGCTGCTLKKNNIDPNNVVSETKDNNDNNENYIENYGSDSAKVAGSDTELIMCLIASEAPYASEDVMVALAAVVYNRIDDANFPNNVYDVIFQPGQFPSVSKGTILPFASVEADKDLYNRTLNAVKAAQNGNDPTNGALHCFKIENGEEQLFPNGCVIGENNTYTTDEFDLENVPQGTYFVFSREWWT